MCNWSNPEYVLQCMHFGVLRRDENWKADGKRRIVVELNEHFGPKSARDRDR